MSLAVWGLVLLALAVAESATCDYTHVVEVMKGVQARIPCIWVPSGPDGQAKTVEWFGPLDKKARPFFSADLDTNKDTWSLDLVYEIKRISHTALELSIKQITFEEEGDFECRVSFGEKSSNYTDCTIVRLVEPPVKSRIYSPQISYHDSLAGIVHFSEGCNVTLQCIAEGGRPAPVVTWWVGNDVALVQERTSKDDVTISTLNLGRLVLPQIYRTYSCEIRSSKLWVHHISIVPKIRTMAREVLLRSNRTSMWEGERVSFTCEALGAEPSPRVDWWLGSSAINFVMPSVSVRTDIVTSTIALTMDRTYNRTNVTCITVQSVPSHGVYGAYLVGTSASLRLTVLNPVLTIYPADVTVENGSVIALNCCVTPYVPGKFQWIKQSRVKSGGNQTELRNVTLQTGAELLLESISPDSQGFYFCNFISDDHDVLTQSTEVRVRMPPPTGEFPISIVMLAYEVIGFITLFTILYVGFVVWSRQDELRRPYYDATVRAEQAQDLNVLVSRV